MDQNSTPAVDSTEMYVSKFYEMNPSTEDLLEGDELKDDMKVLIAEPIYREDLDFLKEGAEPEGYSAYKLDRVRECNRWCTISRVRVTHAGTVSFFATYEDGTKRKRVYNRSHTWLVKLDSIPQEPARDENGDQVGNEKTVVVNVIGGNPITMRGSDN